jgi:hypothetical protein
MLRDKGNFDITDKPCGWQVTDWIRPAFPSADRTATWHEYGSMHGSCASGARSGKLARASVLCRKCKLQKAIAPSVLRNGAIAFEFSWALASQDFGP